MKNTNTKEYNEALQAYLEPIILDKANDYEVEIVGNPYQWVIDTAKSEVSHEFKKNDQDGLEYWLSGLGLNLDYNYCDIIAVCEKLHDCKLTDKQAEICQNGWFKHIAAKILQYARKAA